MAYRYSTAVTRSAVALILFAFVCTAYIHRQRMAAEVEEALAEHALVAAKPLWSYETDWGDEYFAIVAEKYNYQHLKVTREDGEVLYEQTTSDSGPLHLLLSRIHLIPLKNFEKEIYYNNNNVGKIVVVWRDTSIYFSAYAFFVSMLLIVIVNLYARIAGSKTNLERQVEVIAQQLVELRKQKNFIENIFNVVPEGLITLTGDGRWGRNNHSFDLLVDGWSNIIGKSQELVRQLFLDGIAEQVRKCPRGQYSMSVDGYVITIDYSSSQLLSSLAADRVISLRDVSKISEMERELNQSRKLEAVGRLAAGIAHEINTPTQYVFANIDFLSEAYGDIGKVLAALETLPAGEDTKTLLDKCRETREALAEADWEFLKDEIPKALAQSQDGLRRISSIVSAMKHFSHPSGDKAVLADINSAIENTVVVARNEWKYFSEVTLHLDPDIPQVPCYLDELNQVFLAMIVNSAHAIAQKYGENKDRKGQIAISTEQEERGIVIVIADDGIGMSKGVKEKVFDPFFTTKEINKGTGQGLAIARDVIVNHHKGTITVESEEGIGTTFIIVLPLS